MTRIETWNFTKKLFIDTFTRGGSYREDFTKVQFSLGTRAWMSHFFIMGTRVIYPLFGAAYW